MSLGDRIVVMSQGRVAQVGRPRDIYFAPASRFVADFVGTMNAVKGVARDGHLVLPGGRIPWKGPATGEVEVLFRPESVSLVDAMAAHVSGRVLTSFFLGDRTRLVVEGVADTPLVVETSERREFARGEAVHLALDPTALLSLDR
jgi:putative spermidine/putrescine transport system ATP-binding protein